VRFIGALHSGKAYGVLLEVGDRFYRSWPCKRRRDDIAAVHQYSNLGDLQCSR
jgi:hypothetical protein